MNDHIDIEIQRRYDQYILESGGALPSGDVKSAIELDIAMALEAVERDYPAEARLRIDKVIHDSRKARRGHVKRNVETILAASLPEDAEYIDPLLDIAYPLGTYDGLDKPLRFWTEDDFDNLVATAFKASNLAKASADDLYATVQRIKGRLASSGATAFGDAVTIRQAAA